MNSNAKKMQKKKSGMETVLVSMLLVFILFSSVFTPVLLIRHLANDPSDQGTPTPKVTTPSNDGPVVDPPIVSNPLFSGGKIPAYPSSGSATVSLNSELYSEYAVIVDAQTGEIVAGKNVDTPFSPASMTKVMTLIVACEKLNDTDLQHRMAYTSYYYDRSKYNGMSCSFTTDMINETILVNDILYAIGMESAADAVLMIAEYTYGTLDNFVAQMNRKAEELGLKNTKFVDASGDYFPGTQYTTAQDMAVIMSYATQIPLIKSILSTPVHKASIGYIKNDAPSFYNITLYSNLFENGNVKGDGTEAIDAREEYYRVEYNKKFQLDTTKDLFGKTGYLEYKGENNTTVHESYLVCAATGKTSGKQYIVVAGNASRIAPTMKDIKYLFDTYAK